MMNKAFFFVLFSLVCTTYCKMCDTMRFCFHIFFFVRLFIYIHWYQCTGCIPIILCIFILFGSYRMGINRCVIRFLMDFFYENWKSAACFYCFSSFKSSHVRSLLETWFIYKYFSNSVLILTKQKVINQFSFFSSLRVAKKFVCIVTNCNQTKKKVNKIIL